MIRASEGWEGAQEEGGNELVRNVKQPNSKRGGDGIKKEERRNLRRFKMTR